MKRIAPLLLFLACSPPDPTETASSADAGVQATAAPATVTPGTTDARVRVILTIRYDPALDRSLEQGIVPASWICPPMGVNLVSADGQMNYGYQTLPGATAVELARGDCSGAIGIKSCTYTFPSIGVLSSRGPINAWHWANVACGHGLTGVPPSATFTAVGGSTQDLNLTVGGPWASKGWWREQICDSGCYACGEEWYSAITTIDWKQCTYNPQARGCLTPCSVTRFTW